MNCAWKEFLAILPPRLREDADALGKHDGQNLRLRLGAPPELNCAGETHWLKGEVSREELDYCVNAASRYSPWAAATVSRGYITAPGGHRLGICGEAVVKNGEMCGIRQVSSICIRIARDFPGISRELAGLNGSILIIGAPGWGKTTLLRDLIRQKSQNRSHVSVVDEREELFPLGLPRGCRMEILSGCPKAQGIDQLIRTMEPDFIALDEITAESDCAALCRAARCGVGLMSTAHASSLHDLLHREVYAPLVKQNLFEYIVILRSDKSWHLERSGGWSTNGSARY